MGINLNQPFNLHDVRKTINDPARPYMFLVTIPEIGSNSIVTAMCRSASIPARTNSEIPIAFQGMNLYIGGTPTYEDWTVSFLCDEAHELRRLFLKWASLVYDAGTGFIGHSASYKSDNVGVAQLSRNNAQVAKIGFVGAWPKVVGNIELAQGQSGEAETFPVTFRYDYYVQVNQFGEQTTTGSEIRPTTSTRLSRGTPPPGGNWTQFRPQ